MKVKYNFPETAKNFLKFIETNRQPNTLYSYSTTLKQFHSFLNQEGIDLEGITRQHSEGFMKWLKAQGKGPATRAVRLMELRIYFYWLYEFGKINTDPFRLIRNTDLPTIPDRLPRPLTPEVDKILIDRLKKSNCSYCKGLLIQRFTGLRISELSKLDFKCIKTTSDGDLYIKVPIGKLHNERLVPITEDVKSSIIFCQKQTLKRVKNKHPKYLIAGLKTESVCLNTYRRALFDITNDIKHLESDKISPHRLRHTYATELINSGMSLIGVMKLLGHRSPNMTLTYAQITGETIRNEYYSAIKKMREKHKEVQPKFVKTDLFDPIQALEDLKKWISVYTKTNKITNTRKYTFLLDRTRRLQKQIEELL